MCRLFAVGYATRQLSGLPGRKPDWELELQSLLHASAQHALDNQTDCLLAAVPGLREQQQHLQQGSAGDAGGSSDMEALFQQSLDAALLMTDALACRQHQLLAAVSGPRDLLIPPAQQKLPPDCRPTRQLEAALLHYIHHRPPSTLPSPATQPHETPQTGLRAPQQQQLKQQQAPAQEACKPPQMQQPPRDDAQRDQGSDLLLRLLTAEPTGRSDVSALVLSSPCPVEALLDPEVWWSWQQALLKLDTCDTCGADTLQVGVCDT